MTKINLGIHKRFLIIDSPIDFELLANFGTDSVKRSAGTWSIDCYRLLPEEYQKNYPVYNLQLIYDESKLKESENVSYSFTDMDLGQALKGVNGQVVELTSMQLEQLKPEHYIAFRGNPDDLRNEFYYVKNLCVLNHGDRYYFENSFLYNQLRSKRFQIYGKWYIENDINLHIGVKEFTYESFVEVEATGILIGFTHKN